MKTSFCLLFLTLVGISDAFSRQRCSYSLLKIQMRLHQRPQRRTGSLQMIMGGLGSKLGDIVELMSGQTKITEANIEDTLREVKGILLDADVNLQVTNALIAKVKERAIGMKLDAGQKPGEKFIQFLAAELVETMGSTQVPLTKRTDGRPNIILMAGLQGAGKTTAVAKLANWALKQSYSTKILLVAADIYRPAAIDQLKVLGERLGVDVFSEEPGIGAVQISRRAVAKALAEGYDTVIIDTAGRQVVDAKLMDELKQVKQAVLPDETLLVVDAMTGQEAATLTQRFNEDVGITGAILTKLDGDTRGGSALSVRGVSGKAIKFVGVGEGMDDLEPFYPERMASRILGMGDIATLVEKAQSSFDLEKTKSQLTKMQKGNFDFNDYFDQLQSVKRLGGMSGMLKMLPGGGKVKDDQLFEAESRMKKNELILNAMTPDERTNTELLTLRGGKKEMVLAALKAREDLAKRAGVTPNEVETFCMEFANMKKAMGYQLKGTNVESMTESDAGSFVSPRQKAMQEKKDKKIKPTRGGGGGFGR